VKLGHRGHLRFSWSLVRPELSLVVGAYGVRLTAGCSSEDCLALIRLHPLHEHGAPAVPEWLKRISLARQMLWRHVRPTEART
jgi:hypothetical protein